MNFVRCALCDWMVALVFSMAHLESLTAIRIEGLTVKNSAQIVQGNMGYLLDDDANTCATVAYGDGRFWLQFPQVDVEYFSVTINGYKPNLANQNPFGRITLRQVNDKDAKCGDFDARIKERQIVKCHANNMASKAYIDMGTLKALEVCSLHLYGTKL